MNTRIPRRASRAPSTLIDLLLMYTHDFIAVPVTPSSSGKGKAKQDPSEDLNISAADEDADGEPDTHYEDVTHASIQYLRQEEEEELEEGEEIEIPRRPVSPPAKPQAPPPKAARPVKPLPKPKAPAAVPPQPTTKAVPPPPPDTPARAPSPKARPVPKPKKTKPVVVNPPPPTNLYPDEEVIEFGKPAKRPRPSTPQQPPLPAPAPAPVGLSLPGATTSFAPLPNHSKSIVAPPASVASPPTMVQEDSDDDNEDWEQVPTIAPADPQPQTEFDLTLEQSLEEEIFGNNFGDADGGEEIDANAFEAELNEEMEDSEDDFLAAAVRSDSEQQTRQPIFSLNRLASGAGAADSEEDFSSSDDESDED
jgi:hypothetical protein